MNIQNNSAVFSHNGVVFSGCIDNGIRHSRLTDICNYLIKCSRHNMRYCIN